MQEQYCDGGRVESWICFPWRDYSEPQECSERRRKVNELADDFQTQVVGTLSHSGLVTEAEEKKETVMECFPDSEMAEEYRKLAEAIYELSKRPEGSACEKADEKYTADKRPGEGLKC